MCLDCIEAASRNPSSLAGHGVSGTVFNVSLRPCCTPKDKRSEVAVKCVKKFDRTAAHALYLLREVRILRHITSYPHPNLLSLRELIPEGCKDTFSNIYMVTDVMETNLRHALQLNSGQLSEFHIKYMIYQIIKGIYALHQSNIIHRDIKPENILINSDCDIKLCDFGLARTIVPYVCPSPISPGSISIFSPGRDLTEIHELNGRRVSPDLYPPQSPNVIPPLSDAPVSQTLDFNLHVDQVNRTQDPLTEYVVTRHYRAPEVLLEAKQYGKPVDIWAAGCVLAEMLRSGQVLFKGSNSLSQVSKIFAVTGVPADELLDVLESPTVVKKYMKQLRSSNLRKQSMRLFLPENVSDEVVDLLEHMLELDPANRYTAEQCLRHPFLAHFFSEQEDLSYQSAPLDLNKQIDVLWTEACTLKKTSTLNEDKSPETIRKIKHLIHAECTNFC